MGLKLFSSKDRAVQQSPYPIELLRFSSSEPCYENVPAFAPLSIDRPDAPASIVNAMGEYQAMMDAIREGFVKPKAGCPDDPQERADHLKSFGYFQDASLVGICQLTQAQRLATPYSNPAVAALAQRLATEQTKTLAAGIDMIMADLRDAVAAKDEGIPSHSHAILLLFENPRAPNPSEPGTSWIKDAQDARAALLASEAATILAQYLRLLGYSARAHSATTSDVDLNRLAVASGLAHMREGQLSHPLIGSDFGLAAVTTEFELACDQPLAQGQTAAQSMSWLVGSTANKSARTKDPFAKRDFILGPHPFETLKRSDTPTTFIDEPRVARVPKRADMFARAQFGDMGKKPQIDSTRGKYAAKASPSMAQRRMLGALVLIQDGPPTPLEPEWTNPQSNADHIKAAGYWLGCDAIGISHCPDYAYYSHNALGEVLEPYHDQAISIIIDQGFDTMEGASGDDWISVAQSMRAYLRFSLVGGVLAKQIRNLGYQARTHTVLDGEVLQPPLLLLSGLGEVSRIGEVILNPFLGPRLKSGVVTTNMPLAHDKPIDFGLQKFCESCNKCARECPSGAITAGPKLMFNGYEIWKSDSQKCATYRITTEGGAMCGRCMKTCPWNLEGLFAEAPFRWAASNMPSTAPWLAKLDDALGRGSLNPVKKWWWDLELKTDGSYQPTDKPVNARGLQKDLDLKYEDQTMAVYPAPLAPHPWPYPFMMDREKGIEAYQAMITAEQYKAKLEAGETEGLFHIYSADGDSPVQRVEITEVKDEAAGLKRYVLQALDKSALPAWTAGAHIDIVISPEYLRQYSITGDPADQSRYILGILREDGGKGGSTALHRIFTQGRKVFISKPINHFELDETAGHTLLMGGGIGITPLIAMAHRLHTIGASFELHYCFRNRSKAGFLDDLASAPWSDKVTLHVSSEGTKADLKSLIQYSADRHVYVCGPDPFMEAVVQQAEAAGYPDDARHLEYFAVPEQPEYENHPFVVKIADTDEAYLVPKDQTIADVLNANGYNIDIKCSDGICGVCQCELVTGQAEHRDFVLSKAQRQTRIITCQSRAAGKDQVIGIKV